MRLRPCLFVHFSAFRCCIYDVTMFLVFQALLILQEFAKLSCVGFFLYYHVTTPKPYSAYQDPCAKPETLVVATERNPGNTILLIIGPLY